MRAAAALLLLVLAAVAPALPVGAQDAAPIELRYTLDATDPMLRAQGKVQATWEASGLQDRVSAVCLIVDAGYNDYRVDAATFAPVPPWQHAPSDVDEKAGKPACPHGFRALTGGADHVKATFALDVRKAAFSGCGCEYNSVITSDWGVVKAEALAVPFSYAFYNPQPTFHVTVHFSLPPGWSAEAPWTRLGPYDFELPGNGVPLPRGFIALGRFTPEVRPSGAVGKEFVYARLAQELADKDSLFDYLEKATPYYRSIYGDVTGDHILVISAGAPMFTGGLGSTDSLFVHQNASRATVAHEYAHVWQAFQTIDQAGSSSIWLNEGDADLHGALSRFVTETQPGFDLAQLRKELKEEYQAAVRDPQMQQPLTAANYGGAYEQVAYKKGLFTLLFLDHEMRNLTQQRYGLRDVLAELNHEWETVVLPRDIEHRRMTNEDILRVVDRVLQRASDTTMRPIWEKYVTGSPPGSAWGFSGADWPPYVEAPNEVPIVFSGLTLDETRILPGGELVAHATATNVHANAETRSVQLFIDDQVVAEQNLTVPSLQATPFTLRAPAGPAGAHAARIAYLSAPFRVLTPANLVVDRVTPRAAPQVGEPFRLDIVLRNTGEAPAMAHVQALFAGTEADADVDLPGAAEVTAQVTLTGQQEGPTLVELGIAWGTHRLAASAQVNVGPRDRDHDGVPDASDAYPDNPTLSEKSPTNDLREAVPGPGAGLAALALVGAGLALRRR